MALEGTDAVADVPPSPGRWVWAIVATAFVAPWFSLGGILIVFGILAGFELAHYVLLAGLFMMYGLGFVPSLLSVCGFAVIYGRLRRTKTRNILRKWVALIGFVLSGLCIVILKPFSIKEAGEIIGLTIFYAVNGAMAGYFGGALFMNIVDGRLVPEGPEPLANWHR